MYKELSGVAKTVESELGAVTHKVESAVEHTHAVILPVRESIVKRFPTVFTLLVTFGVAATFFGIERIIADIPWLNERPWFIFGLGLLILILTGRLYKKLS